MSNINKILDRVRKLLALSENSPSENEAALAAANAAKLMEEYQLTEALVRLDAPVLPAEKIVTEQLDPVTNEARKRVAWRETVSAAVADDCQVREYLRYRTVGTYPNLVKQTNVVGMGRESSVQTWRYTTQYLCRVVDELADAGWDELDDYTRRNSSARSWKNAFRVGCASRIAVRLAEARASRTMTREAQVAHAMATLNVDDDRASQALTIVDRDKDQLDAAWAETKKNFSRGKAPSIGQVTSSDGYQAGRAAGDRVELNSSRTGLPAGQGRLTK